MRSESRFTRAQQARDSEHPDRLFFNPLPSVLAGPDRDGCASVVGKIQPATRRHCQLHCSPHPILRRHRPEQCCRGIRQVVLPAAGMDARAFRLSWADGTTLYEVDHPELLATKEEILRQQDRAPQCNRITIGADLKQDWGHMVVDAGFRLGERSVWLLKNSSTISKRLP